MAEPEYSLSKADIFMICDALREGLDVRLHPDKNGVKITSERVRVLKKPEAPRYGFSEKRT